MVANLYLLSIQLLKPNYFGILFTDISTMASLETYSLYSFELKKVAEVVKLKQESSAKYIAKESLFLT